jgi:hypothetical protein
LGYGYMNIHHDTVTRYIIYRAIDNYIALITLNGNISTAPTSLNTISRLNPRILNGNSSSHTMGKINIITIASGQHSTNKIHQSRIANIVFID